LAGESSADGTKLEFTKTTIEAWTAREMPAEKALRAELGKVEGRIIFGAGLGTKSGKDYAPVKDGEGNWEIWSVRPDGTDLRNLTRNPARDDYPRVSPDGTSIAFNSDRELPAGAKMDYLYESKGVGSVIVMSADGSGQKKVCDGMTPAWSPDGKRLAFCRGKQVIIRDLASGKEVVQTPDNWRNAMYPDFAPDGAHLIATGNAGRGWITYGWEFDPATMERKGDIRQLSPTEGCNADMLPDGKGFVYVQDHAGDTFSRLYTATLDWAAAKPGGAKGIPINKDKVWEYYPAPSPNAKYLVYSASAAGKSLGEGWTMIKEQELYVTYLSGGTQVRITFGGLACKHPNWSARLK
jgi:Tol biopolymer transport system component